MSVLCGTGQALPLSRLQCPDKINNYFRFSKSLSKDACLWARTGCTSTAHQGAPVPIISTQTYKRVASVLSTLLYLQKTRYTSSSCGGKWELLPLTILMQTRKHSQGLFQKFIQGKVKQMEICAISITCTSALLITLMKHILQLINEY